jgi:hypothetical protein
LPALSEHIFSNHLLVRSHDAPIERLVAEEMWPSVFLLCCLVTLVLVKVNAYPKVLRIIQSTFSAQILQQLEREEVNQVRFYSVALNLFFILNVSFIIFKINAVYHYVLVGSDHLLQFSFFLGLTVLVYLLKQFFNRLLAFFTGQVKLISEYLVNTTLVNQTFGLFLFPWVVLMQFTEFNPLLFIWAAVAVLVAAAAVKWYRGLMMGLVQERIGLLQIFSYFCGLEILPVFVLVKYIIETF